jgi:FKBP-type peptidyl-prolyl cis-trans isomerase FklB
MKKYLIGAVALTFAVQALAQTKKPAAKPLSAVPAVKTTVAAVKKGPSIFKTPLDSFSYAIGISMANHYKQQGVTTINTTLLNKGLNDVFKNGKPLLIEEQINMSVTNYLQQLKAGKAAGNKKAGDAFLTENKTKPGIIVTPTGLQYQVLKEGAGARPTAADKVRCHYHGTLIDGTVFDSSVERNQPAEFPVSGVIAGWVEALQLMPVGSKWRLFLPSNLAYGDQQAGAKIGPGSTLIFEVELLDIVK